MAFHIPAQHICNLRKPLTLRQSLRFPQLFFPALPVFKIHPSTSIITQSPQTITFCSFITRNQQELLPGIPAFPILTTPENLLFSNPSHNLENTQSHRSGLKPPILRS